MRAILADADQALLLAKRAATKFVIGASVRTAGHGNVA